MVKRVSQAAADRRDIVGDIGFFEVPSLPVLLAHDAHRLLHGLLAERKVLLQLSSCCRDRSRPRDVIFVQFGLRDLSLLPHLMKAATKLAGERREGGSEVLCGAAIAGASGFHAAGDGREGGRCKHGCGA